MAQVLTFPKSLPVHARVSQEPLVPTPLLGMLLFLFTELMFFAGLISAFLVLKDRSILWPPLDQPRLPIAVTLFNTGILLSSAWTLSRALGQWKRSDFQSGKFWLRITLLLGILFLGIQGLEWARLISYGLTTSSSLYGGTFYLLVGAHGVHVAAAVLALVAVCLKAKRTPPHLSWNFTPTALYWFFVVALWPILFGLVYF